MEYLQVANWESFQHYKNRTPPWIKLHRTLLTDYKFSCLQDASKLHLMLIWLYASQSDNKIPNDPDYLQRVLHLTKKPNLNELIDNGFLVSKQDDSDALADSKQSAPLEEKRREEKIVSDLRNGEVPFSEFWSSFPRKEKRKDAETAWKNLTVKNQQLAMADFPGRFVDTEKRYIPLPTTYIHGERWTDELPDTAGTNFGGDGQ